MWLLLTAPAYTSTRTAGTSSLRSSSVAVHVMSWRAECCYIVLLHCDVVSPVFVTKTKERNGSCSELLRHALTVKIWGTSVLSNCVELLCRVHVILVVLLVAA
jgi:hypothetical protein